MTLTDDEKETFVAALGMGHGLTASANLIQKTPKDISAYIKKENAFRLECEQRMKESSRYMVAIANNLLAAEKFSQFQAANERIKLYIFELVLWESFCTKKNVNPDIVTRATAVYKNAGECATALGMTGIEFVNYVCDNPNLSLYLTTKGIYQF